MLDNWQIRNVESKVLQAERPKRQANPANFHLLTRSASISFGPSATSETLDQQLDSMAKPATS